MGRLFSGRLFSGRLFSGRLFSAIAIAVFAATMAVVPAGAKDKPKSAGSMQAVAAECFRQNGYSYDPAKKTWNTVSSDEGMIRKNDALRECISRGTGISRGSVPITQ